MPMIVVKHLEKMIFCYLYPFVKLDNTVWLCLKVRCVRVRGLYLQNLAEMDYNIHIFIL